MQVRDQIGNLFFIQLIAKLRHHIATADNRLFHVFIGRGQTAGQIRFLVQLLQPWTFVPVRRISGMTKRAMNNEYATTARLLRSQTQLSIGHLLAVFLAAGEQSHENQSKQSQGNGRCQAQVTIMS